MRPLRLDSDERRNTIVQAAVPLFARKGFAGTTTREIAESAGISEALLFKHFPTKQLLYGEILRWLGCQGDPALEQLAVLPPSTGTLVCMIRFMVGRFVLGSDSERAEMSPRLRLVLNSCLEDGAYARQLFEGVCDRVIPYFNASLAVAQAAGDVVAAAGPPENRFWFAQHVAAMMAFAALPPKGCVPYRGTAEQVAAEATEFILRGIGMTEAAIAAHRDSGTSLQLAAD
jgi:TetR/AcrR family transcriptional regulator, transcriptional repressor of aconitase